MAAVRRQADALAPVVPVRVTAEELPPLPPDVETAAYRIAQEALTNVARHSGAAVGRGGGCARGTAAWRWRWSTTARASGREPTTTGPDGVGLDSMRHPGEAVGGDLTVTSGPDGTRVVAGLPLEARP